MDLPARHRIFYRRMVDHHCAWPAAFAAIWLASRKLTVATDRSWPISDCGVLPLYRRRSKEVHHYRVRKSVTRPVMRGTIGRHPAWMLAMGNLRSKFVTRRHRADAQSEFATGVRRVAPVSVVVSAAQAQLRK